MKELKDTIEIKTKPENIFQWFINIEENYKSWHPDHLSWKWIRGKPCEQGSIAIAREYLHGELHTIKSKIITLKKNEIIEYKNYGFISVIAPKGSFLFTPADSDCLFTATLTFRFGNLFSKLFKKRMEALVLHIKEEGENLKRLLEDKS